MEEYFEEMYSGFCKQVNGTRSVFCEFVREEGGVALESTDCLFGTCEHTKTCLLMKPARELLGEDI